MDPTQAPPAPSQDTPALAPLGGTERIEALDVVRGFALIGIFLMNVEWFNRPIEAMADGLPPNLSGVNWWASRLVYVLVQGKFWTMFSLLFGMGFAVMLTRAERAGRNFLRPYLRRIAALALFGVSHHILVWNGDILFSYAVGAVALLIVLYGKWKPILAGLLVLVGLGFIPRLNAVWAFAGSLAFAGVVALYLRGEKRITLRGRSLLLFSFVTLVLGSLVAVFAAVLWALPQGPKEARVPLTLMSAIVLGIGALSARFHDPIEPRARRLGVALYLIPLVVMTAFGVVQYLKPPIPTPQGVQPIQTPPGTKAGERKGPKTEAEKQAESAAKQAEQMEKHREEIRTELRVFSRGTYREGVRLRARHFLKNLPIQAGFAAVLLGMFLLGTWFVRSGVMENPANHLPLFRRLAWTALPLGVGLGLVGSAISTAGTPGMEGDPFQAATGLLMIGNLPACLGYLSLVVLMLHSRGALSNIRILAPAGRMALTHYLTQSLLSSWFFFGYGLGNWGLGRAWQVGYVAVVFSAQLALSHWWLKRFQFGPMEWLWRAITYWRLPAMRLETPASRWIWAPSTARKTRR